MLNQRTSSHAGRENAHGFVPSLSAAAPANFSQTHWSLVLAARQNTSPAAAAALEKLCDTYWYPLYLFICRKGYNWDDARDLTQSFFARLLDKNYLRAVDPSKGKFRSFLLAALDHFLANEWRRSTAQKRGGTHTLVSFEELAQDQDSIPVADLKNTPEQIFEKQWALTLLQTVLSRLENESCADNKADQFQRLKIFLPGETNAPYAALSAELGMSEGALKMAVSRLRKRYGEVLMEEIAATVARPEDVEEELRALLAALSL